MKEAYNSFVRERVVGDLDIMLPVPPARVTIDGYNVASFNQRFRYTEQPKKGEEPSDDFLEREVHRMRYGYWFFNNGRLEYITGYHYIFLNYWKDRGKKLSFVDAQRDFFYWWDAIEKDKNIAFGNLITNRRFGKTVIATFIAYIRSSTKEFQYAGIQSKTGPDAKGVFNKLISSWTSLPEWLKPIDVGESRPASVLEFFEPRKRASKDKKVYGDALNSKIDFKSSGEVAYDGEELNTYIADEIGKCFGEGTEILMHDGSVKRVEDIEEGEFVMGNDSTHRIVYGKTTGIEELYKIIPNKGDFFVCNKSHILTLSVSDSIKINGKTYKTGDIVNITISEYLTITEKRRKCLALYRTGWELKEKEHLIDPYMFGVWLGDGSSRDFSITTTDTEIIECINDFANNHNLYVRRKDDNISYHVTSKRVGVNHITKELRRLNVLKDKHIPDEYLIDSRENRLKLLAGLIDTDGHVCQKALYSSNIEITQKKQSLAIGIQKLATSLGFYVKFSEKEATMKRSDNSMYRCKVYRVILFGDLHLIPTKIKRKKCLTSTSINRRNPQKTGFKIESIGEGKYFGFAVDKNHLFLLKDGTVVHNTIDANVFERHEVAKKCLMKASTINGRGLNTTTVEEMEKKGGKNFKLVWDSCSKKLINPKTGRNPGLGTNLFVPADFGYFGEHPVTGIKFVDEYGYSNREAAHQYILDTWEGLEGDALASAQRKDPLNIKHVWQLKNFASTFDNELLEIQKDYLERNNLNDEENAPPNLVRRVTFYKDIDDIVKWRDDPKGFFQMVWDFDNIKYSNKRKQHESGLWQPTNTESFAIGVDPFAATITTGTEKSMGVAYVYKKGDSNDPENSGLMVVRYAQRTRYKAEFHRNIMLLCQYFGCKANYESNVDDYYEKFIEEGFKHYVMWRPKCTIDPQRKNVKVKYGTPSNDGFALQKQTIIADEYIKSRYHKIYFLELVNQLIDFDPDNRTKFDDAIAFMMALIGGVEGTGKPTDNKKPKKILVRRQSKKYY